MSSGSISPTASPLSATSEAGFIEVLQADDEGVRVRRHKPVGREAIGARDWMPKEGRPAMRIVRFTDGFLADEVLTAPVEHVPVNVFGVAGTITDCFRHRRKVGLTVALERLREVLRHAARGGVATVVRPSIEAFTAHAWGGRKHRGLGSGPSPPPATLRETLRQADLETPVPDRAMLRHDEAPLRAAPRPMFRSGRDTCPTGNRGYRAEPPQAASRITRNPPAPPLHDPTDRTAVAA